MMATLATSQIPLKKPWVQHVKNVSNTVKKLRLKRYVGVVAPVWAKNLVEQVLLFTCDIGTDDCCRATCIN